MSTKTPNKDRKTDPDVISVLLGRSQLLRKPELLVQYLEILRKPITLDTISISI
jgi:hypothetical protein